MMTNRSDRGSAKPRGSQRFERDDVIREPACGLHQGQQPSGAARTGRTHGCTRPVLIAKQKLLRRRGRPHMDLQRPHHCTTTLVQGPSTPSRQYLLGKDGEYAKRLATGIANLESAPNDVKCDYMKFIIKLPNALPEISGDLVTNIWSSCLKNNSFE